MLEAKLATAPVSLEDSRSLSEEDRIKMGQLLMQAIDVFSSHPKAVSVADLANARQCITIPLEKNEIPEIPVDNLNVAILTITQNQPNSDSYQLRLRERVVEAEGVTPVITQDIFWHVEKPRAEGRLGKFERRILVKPQEPIVLQVKDAMAIEWRQTYKCVVPDASINITRPDQTSQQNFYAISDLGRIQREILSKLPQIK